MNLEVRRCACGASPEKGANHCPSCGAGLAPLADPDSPREVIEANATVPLIAANLAPSSANDSGIAFAPGAVFGSYRLVKQIGRGGMGHVFIAEHTRLRRQVAVKILRSEYSNNREAVRRFFAEAQAVNRINHENIIEISDFIENPQGPSLYVMELLKGTDLRSLEDSAGILPLRRALAIAVQVCRGLGAAHDAGIVHRDLKPDNIFLIDREGRADMVKLLDFGVAKLMNAALDDTAATFKSMAGIVVGTPAYMAPEQAMADEVDHRADIYSLGVILFELVTGKRPFVADSAREVMAKHMMEAPARPNSLRTMSDGIPWRLENLILACLKKDARDRPQSIKEVEQRLRDVLDDVQEDPPVFGFKRHFSNRYVWLGFATSVAVLGLVSVALLVPDGKKKPVVAAIIQPKVPEPPPAPPRAVPDPKIEVSFVSNPAGAAVFQAGAEQPLGVTPFSVQLDRSTEPQLFEFRRDGWQVGRQNVTLSHAGRVEIALTPVTSVAGKKVAAAAAKRGGTGPMKKAELEEKLPVTPKPEPRPPVKLDSDVVLNPFE